MPRSPTESHAQIIRQINLTLEGPVAEVMAQLVPELKKLPRRGAGHVAVRDGVGWPAERLRRPACRMRRSWR